jgi:hypothetical protein
MSTGGERVRRAATVATGLVHALVALGACSSGSSGDATDGKDAGRTTSTTAAPSAQELWVAKWRGTVAEQYGPAQQAFLAAVQAGQVPAVRAAVVRMLDANQALLDAVAAAGDAPADARQAAARLELALHAERKLLDEIQQACTGRNDACQTAVTQYGDNNSKQVVPAFVALKI